MKLCIDVLFPLLVLPPPLRCHHLACLRHRCRCCRRPRRTPPRCCCSPRARASPVSSCVCEKEGLVGHSSGSSSGYCRPQRGPCSCSPPPTPPASAPPPSSPSRARCSRTARAKHLYYPSPYTPSDNRAYSQRWECPCTSTEAAPPATRPRRAHQWAHILSLHLQRRVVPSNDASAALMVLLAHDFFRIFLSKEREGIARTNETERPSSAT